MSCEEFKISAAGSDLDRVWLRKDSASQIVQARARTLVVKFKYTTNNEGFALTLTPAMQFRFTSAGFMLCISAPFEARAKKREGRINELVNKMVKLCKWTIQDAYFLAPPSSNQKRTQERKKEGNDSWRALAFAKWNARINEFFFLRYSSRRKQWLLAGVRLIAPNRWSWKLVIMSAQLSARLAWILCVWCMRARKNTKDWVSECQ